MSAITEPRPDDSLRRFVRPCDTRICKRCGNIVTAATVCPLCLRPTAPHPERDMQNDYCVDCGDGPFAADKLHVRTWEEDPYCQMEDGGLVTVCEPCHEKEDADDE